MFHQHFCNKNAVKLLSDNTLKQALLLQKKEAAGIWQPHYKIKSIISENKSDTKHATPGA